MAKEKFDYHTYMNNPPEKVEWLGDDEFEIVVGTKRFYYNDMMDNAAQGIIRKVKYHLKKDGSICEATDLKGEDLYLTDEEEMKLNIVIHNIDDFFDNHDFSPEAFCIFLRYLMRPLSLTDKISAKRNVWKENKLSIQALNNKIIQMLLWERTTSTLFSIKPEEVMPRYQKAQMEQKDRTKKKAEVFTPVSIVKKMNDNFDKDFRGTYLDYIKRTTLEVTCGEAPFITTRYDASTGENIAVKMRVGLLDRKLQHIPISTSPEDWCNLADVSLKSTYGFEWQEDSIFLARKNLLLTTIEHYMDRYEEMPNPATITRWAEIISYNIFRMDGLTFCIPETDIPARIMNWDKNQMENFNE